MHSKGRLVWTYNYADWSLASSLIENTNWDLLFSGDNINRSWTSWHQQFMKIMKECTPNTALRSRRNLPWLNKKLIRAMRRRNKLFKKAKTSIVNMFADDVLLYHIVSCPDDYLDAQHSVTSIEQWSSSNYLQLNVLKCKYMTISRKKKPITPQRALTLNNSILEQVESYKYLGLLLTADLSWSLTSLPSALKLKGSLA